MKNRIIIIVGIVLLLAHSSSSYAMQPLSKKLLSSAKPLWRDAVKYGMPLVERYAIVGIPFACLAGYVIYVKIKNSWMNAETLKRLNTIEEGISVFKELTRQEFNRVHTNVAGLRLLTESGFASMRSDFKEVNERLAKVDNKVTQGFTRLEERFEERCNILEEKLMQILGNQDRTISFAEKAGVAVTHLMPRKSLQQSRSS